MLPGAPLSTLAGEVHYARSGGSHLAYRVIDGGHDDGGSDVVLVLGGTASMESLFEDPVGLRILGGLADLGRVVVFDRSGIGLSDPPMDWDESPFARWRTDLEAVIAAARVTRPVLVSMSASASAVLLYCDRHPDDVTSMVMVEPYPVAGLDPGLVSAQLRGEVDSIALFCPSRADEPGFRAWFTRAGRLGASPRLAARAHPVPDDDEREEIERAAARTRVPTLVLRRPAHPLSPDTSRDEAIALIPGARRVDLPGEDLLIWGGEVDVLLAEVARFVTGEHKAPAPDRSLAAIVFSDLVASTERAATLGDAHWRRLLDQHDAHARSCTGRRGGAVVKTTGDGVLAVFPCATNAVLAACELRAALLEAGLDVRTGVHVGDIDRRDGDVSGIAVSIAARIMAGAGAGEVLVSAAVPITTAGSGLAFGDRGRHRLKGLSGEWHLYEVVDDDGSGSGSGAC